METEMESLGAQCTHQSAEDIFKRPNLLVTIKLLQSIAFKESEMRSTNKKCFQSNKKYDFFKLALQDKPDKILVCTYHKSTQFEDVRHNIDMMTGDPGCFNLKHRKRSHKKIILKGISGAVSPGELLAILGPSGSGKTTLLTALGGRLGTGETRGSMSYNNKPMSVRVKRKIGFVAQSNVFYPHLTVHETLVFTALLRLPNSFTNQEKILQAEAVINQLGLNQCKDTVVGGKFRKGVSGGEQKRVSIGQELLINPSLLFLDEPTSGLDSTIAKQILLVLWRMAKSGRTILMTIHQPASSLFYMFTKVLLLSEGSSLYFGKGDEVMSHFASIGFEPKVAMNPSDFLLDLANGVSGDPEEDRKAVKEILLTAYKSNLSEKLKAEFQEIGDVDHSLIVSEKKKNNWSTTWCQQFIVLLKRDLKQRRRESFSGLKICQVLILAVITGLVWWQSSTANIQDQVGLLFFYSRFGGFFPLFQAIHTFPLDRMMLGKERSSSMYRLSSYFMAKTIGDLPMELSLPTVFVVVTYWMAGLKRTATNFFYTLSVTLYTALVAQSLGLAIGATVTKQKTAATIAATLVLLFLLSGGYFVQHVPVFISWFEYLSLTSYSYKLLLSSQYEAYNRASSDVTAASTSLQRDFPRMKAVGFDHQVVCVAALTVMFVGFRLIAYLALIKVIYS